MYRAAGADRASGTPTAPGRIVDFLLTSLRALVGEDPDKGAVVRPDAAVVFRVAVGLQAAYARQPTGEARMPQSEAVIRRPDSSGRSGWATVGVRSRPTWMVIRGVWWMLRLRS